MKYLGFRSRFAAIGSISKKLMFWKAGVLNFRFFNFSTLLTWIFLAPDHDDHLSRTKIDQISSKSMIFMVLPSRIHHKLQLKTLLVIYLALGKQLEPLGNSFHAPFYMKYKLKTENDQFWLTPREESEGTL